MKLLWVCAALPLIVMLWLLSRFQFRISLHRPGRDRARWVPSTVTRADKSVKMPVPDHVMEMIKEGRHEEAMKAMRELSGAKLDDGGGEVKTWTSEDGTVHVESRSVTYASGDIPPDVRTLIRDGDVKEVMKRLRGAGVKPTAPTKEVVIDANAIPTRAEINDPKPKPFTLDE